jgi:hypothetical protein
MNNYEPPKSDLERKSYTGSEGMKRRLSLIYLITKTLALIGFISFFHGFPHPFLALFIFAMPFYLATLTHTIFIHPLTCLLLLIRKKLNRQSNTTVLIHLLWSLILAITFTILVYNGYVITV